MVDGETGRAMMSTPDTEPGGSMEAGPEFDRRIQVFRYISELDAFTVTDEYREIAYEWGIAEWNPVVWIGRLFTMDNDFGEHWFDNWDEREAIRKRAAQLGYEAELLILNAGCMADGRDGPCHTPEVRLMFWRDVLCSLRLSLDVMAAEARANKARCEKYGDTDPEIGYVPDLEERIAARVEGGGT